MPSAPASVRGLPNPDVATEGHPWSSSPSQLPRRPPAPPDASSARSAPTNRLPQETCEDAVLLVSEIVGNSLRHARSEARIRVDLIGRVMRVEVADDSPELPQLQNAPADATDGRGVRILEEVASRWGADRRTVPPPGKVVWFELAGA